MVLLANSNSISPFQEDIADDSPEIVNSILHDVDIHNFWRSRLSAVERIRFFLLIAIKTTDACNKGLYTDFDAHTTSNCCHGMSILVYHLIKVVSQSDLQALEADFTLLNFEFNKKEDAVVFEIDWIPKEFLCLMGLYILTFVGEIDPIKGRRTNPKKIQSLINVGKKFCDNLVKELQKTFSNTVAHSYYRYLQKLPNTSQISGAPISEWGKYIAPDMLRKDQRAICYASCLFSMQVSLAYLRFAKIKIGIANDLLTPSGELCGRSLHLLEGTLGGFREISIEDESSIPYFDPRELIIVFGACAISDHSDKQRVTKKLKKWMSDFSLLILACDLHYPQFPKVMDDPNFNSNPIIPKDDVLLRKFRDASHITGVSAQNPDLFFLTHIYPASLKQFFSEKQKSGTLPLSSAYTCVDIFNSCKNLSAV